MNAADPLSSPPIAPVLSQQAGSAPESTTRTPEPKKPKRSNQQKAKVSPAPAPTKRKKKPRSSSSIPPPHTPPKPAPVTNATRKGSKKRYLNYKEELFTVQRIRELASEGWMSYALSRIALGGVCFALGYGLSFFAPESITSANTFEMIVGLCGGVMMLWGTAVLAIAWFGGWLMLAMLTFLAIFDALQILLDLCERASDGIERMFA